MAFHFSGLEPNGGASSRCSVSVSLAFLLAFSLHASTQNAAPPASPFSALHIEVIAAHGRVMSPKNFSVTQGSKQYSVTLMHPAGAQSGPNAGIPTHVLVVLSRPIASIPAALRESLHEVLARGWWVSVMQPGGYRTPYVRDEQGFEKAVAAAPAENDPDDADHGQREPSRAARYRSAALDLALYSGRRVLIVMRGAFSDAAPQDLGRMIPEIYLAVGPVALRAMRDQRKAAETQAGARDLLGEDANGQPRIDLGCINPDNSDVGARSPICAGPESASGSGEMARVNRRTGAATPFGFAGQARATIVGTVDDALQRALGSAADYYDLQVTVPTSALLDPFTLRFRHLQSASVTGAAAIYTLSPQAGGPPRREPSPGGLILKM